MLACETVGRGRCFHGLGTVVTETGPQTVGRGASGSRRLGRWGEGAARPGGRPRASSLPVTLVGLLPRFLPAFFLVSSLCIAYFPFV